MPATSSNLIDFNIRRQVHLERLKSGNEREFRSFLQKMREQLIASASTGYDGLTRGRFEQKLRTLDNALRSTQEQYKDVWLGQINDVGVDDAEFEQRALENVVVDHEFSAPTPAQIRTAISIEPLSVEGIHGGKLLDPFFKDMAESDISRLNGVIRRGYALGNTNNQIISDALESIGGFEKTARALVRTGVQHASQTARFALYQNNLEIVKKYRWVSTLDNRTSNICKSLSGQIFDFGKGPLPPIHIGCRSTTTAVLDERFNFLNEGATRSARGPDGKVVSVDVNETYYSWLKKQPVDFQRSAIGNTWTKLLNDGKISASRFAELRLDRDFRPITLDQARQLEPTIFKNAGV